VCAPREVSTLATNKHTVDHFTEDLTALSNGEPVPSGFKLFSASKSRVVIGPLRAR
jgi:hypothetical protein